MEQLKSLGRPDVLRAALLMLILRRTLRLAEVSSPQRSLAKHKVKAVETGL